MNHREPYVGPRPFRTDEADRFFGRRGKAYEVANTWLAERLVVLHGPASVGKTSLLHAGVLPLLGHREEIDLLPIGHMVHQGAVPLARRSADYAYPLLSSWSGSGPMPTPGISVAGFLRARPRRTNEYGEPSSVLAAIDQFEELLDAPPMQRADRDVLIDQLAEALEMVPSLNLLLIIRDDHVGTLSAYEDRFRRPRSPARIALAPLALDEAEEAVTSPLEGTGRSFAEGIARRLINDLRTVTIKDRVGNSVTLEEDQVEPFYLQIACLSLWESAESTDSDVIAEAHLRRVGDVDQVVMAYYDRAVGKISAEHDVSEEKLRGWLETTFITPYLTRATAYRGPLTTADMANDIVDALIEQQILTPEFRARLTWYQLGQDRLITAIQQANMRWREGHSVRPDPPQTPEHPADFRAAAETALGEGDFATAYRYAEVAAERYQAMGDERHLAHALALKGDISRLSGDTSAAKDNFRAALATLTRLEDQYGSARLLAAMANLHLDEGRHAAAADLFRQAVQRAPGDPDILTGLGYAIWRGGSPADALATFTRALDAKRNLVPALSGRGQIRADLGEYDQALDDLDRALAVGVPSDEETDLRSARALALAGLGRTDEAEAELAAALRGDPGRALTLMRSSKIAELADNMTTVRRDI